MKKMRWNIFAPFFEMIESLQPSRPTARMKSIGDLETLVFYTAVEGRQVVMLTNIGPGADRDLMAAPLLGGQVHECVRERPPLWRYEIHALGEPELARLSLECEYSLIFLRPIGTAFNVSWEGREDFEVAMQILDSRYPLNRRGQVERDLARVRAERDRLAAERGQKLLSGELTDAVLQDLVYGDNRTHPRAKAPARQVLRLGSRLENKLFVNLDRFMPKPPHHIKHHQRREPRPAGMRLEPTKGKKFNPFKP